MKNFIINSKKTISIFVLLVMITSVLPVFALDSEVPTLVASSEAVFQGGTATIKVTLDKPETISGIQFFIDYEEDYFDVESINDVVISEQLDELAVEKTLDKDNGMIKLIGAKTSNSGITTPVDVVTFTIKAKQNAPYGAYDIIITDYFLNRINGEGTTKTVIQIIPETTNGIITVKKPAGGSSASSDAGKDYINSPAPSPTASPSVSPSPSPSVEPSTSPDPSGAAKFDDLDGYDWAKEAIDILVKRGIIKGTSETKYEPERNITRAEFSKLIVTAFGFDDIDDTKTFTDVNKDDWYYSVVLAAAKSGIVTGYEDGGFKPNAPITREEMAVILVRAFKAAEIEVPDADMTFADADEMGEWSKEFISALAKLGIVGGRGNNMFVPKANLTRAEAAKVIFSSLGLLEE